LTTHVSFWRDLETLVSGDGITRADLVRILEDTTILGEVCENCGVSFAPIRGVLLGLANNSEIYERENFSPLNFVEAIIEKRSSGKPLSHLLNIYIDMTGDETWAEFEAMLREVLEASGDEESRVFLNQIIEKYIHDPKRPSEATPILLMHYLVQKYNLIGSRYKLVHVATVTSKEELLAALEELIPDDEGEQ
jgi:hypothetical protein